MVSKYRDDITGLRGIAVLAVVIFHINESWIPGGFLGVDIFFVLSGFLITQKIVKDISNGNFSVSDFYLARIKRILPAMFLMVFVVLITAQFVFLPLDAEKVSESAIASSFSVANVYYWLFQDTSYFAGSSREIPLLHLWSLGVEEQFYIFWPLLLLLFKRYHKSSLGLICVAAMALVSILIAEVAFEISHSFTYYMLPTRAGELLVGALSAVLLVKVDRVNSFVSNVVSTVALLLLIFCLFIYDEKMVFPGVAALLPIISVALILLCGHENKIWFSPLLTNKIIIFLGLISYSLYLWHWPVLSFYRYGLMEIDSIDALIIFVVMISLGFLSYRYVEKPTRKYTGGTFKITGYFLVFPILLIVPISLVSMKTDGSFIQKMNLEKYKIGVERVKSQIPSYKSSSVCQTNTPDDKFLVDENCVIGNGSPVDTFLFGDSNASHYVGLFSVTEPSSFRNSALGGCPVVLGSINKIASVRRLPDCEVGVPMMLNETMKYKNLIYSLSWSDYKKRDPDFMNQVESTIVFLLAKGKKIKLVAKLNRFGEYNRECEARSDIYFKDIDCLVAPKPMLEDISLVNAELKEIASRHDGVVFFDPNEVLCKNNMCSIYDRNGTPLYYDKSHLSMKGSIELGTRFEMGF